MATVLQCNGRIIPAGTLDKQWDDWQPLLYWSGCAMNMVVDRYEGHDEIMSAAKVAKRNKILKTADHTVDQKEQKMENNRNGVEKGMFAVDETMEDEEVKLGNEVEKEKSLKYAKKPSVHFVSKGRGVSGFTRERARVKGTSDSTNVYPFLTV
jgi:ribosomal protein L3